MATFKTIAGIAPPRLDPNFKERVARLVIKRKAVEETLKDARLALLDFCREYFKLLNAAKRHSEKEYLATETGINDATMRNTYKAIGGQYVVLKQNLAFLPSSQESIKALAKAEMRKPGAIDILKTKKVLVLTKQPSHSEVCDGIRTHVDKVKKSKPIIDVPVGRQSGNEYVVRFQTTAATHKALVAALAKLLQDAKIRAAIVDGPLHDDVKESLGEAWLQSDGERLVQG